jgi:hypothetical protein
VRRSPKLLLFIALAVAASCSRSRLSDLEPGERRAFRASSVHTEFFIVGEFDGVADVWRDSILVSVTRGRIDTRGTPDDDVLLPAALASGDPAARWRVRDASGADGRPLLHTAFAHSEPDLFIARSDAGESQP